MRNRALLLCASHNDLGLLRALRKLGYEIIVTGNVPRLAGEQYADTYIQADYSDKTRILEIAKEKRVDVISQCCNDLGVYTASYVAELLGLPGYDPYETTLKLHNKDKFKEFAKKYQIPTPEAVNFSCVSEAMEYLKQVKYPVIVKPVDASAGNGVQRMDSKQKAEDVVEHAFSKSREGRIVIEKFLDGAQYGFCTFLVDQKVRACCSNNEYSFLNPYRVEIDTFPADNFSQVGKILVEQIEKIASILQLKNGIFHLQYRMGSDGKPYILEVMRRVLGNMYSVPANQLNGMDWDYWETKAKCGLSMQDFPVHTRQEGYYAYKAILAGKNGRIKGISIPKRYDKYKMGEYFLKNSGDIIENYKSEPLGFLFFIFSSQEEMYRILVHEYDGCMVEMEEIQ